MKTYFGEDPLSSSLDRSLPLEPKQYTCEDYRDRLAHSTLGYVSPATFEQQLQEAA